MDVNCYGDLQTNKQTRKFGVTSTSALLVCYTDTRRWLGTYIPYSCS